MNDHQRAHASFTITGDALDPAFWTEYFGVTPDRAIIKGVRFVTPSGQLSLEPGVTGLWKTQSRHAVQSDFLEPHCRELIARLKLPRAGLRELLREKNARVEL